MTDKIKTFWDRYAVQIISVLVVAVGFYFTTTIRLDAHKDMILNHEQRIKTVEIEMAKGNVILERLEKKTDQIEQKLDKLIESKGIK